MNRSDALHRLAEALRVEADAVDALAEGLEEELPDPGPPVADLTVADIAEAHDRATSTVRQWLAQVPGTYKLGSEIRISRAAWRRYLDSLPGEDPDAYPEEGDDHLRADLAAWRDELREAG